MVFIFSGCFDNTQTGLQSIVELNSSFIGENNDIELVIQIDDKNYVIVVGDENNEFDYTLYNYNIDIEENTKNMSLNAPFNYIGLDRENKLLILALRKSSIDENLSDEIVYINYEKMELEKRMDEYIYNLNHVITEDAKFMAFCGKEGLYAKDLITGEESLLLIHSIDLDNVMDSEIFKPIEIVGDKIIYKKIGYEWVEGFGIIGRNGQNNNYFEAADINYLYYDELKNEIYYTEIFEPREIYKVNIHTKEVVKTFTITDELKPEVVDREIYILEDFSGMLSYEYMINTGRMEIKDFVTGKTIAIHEFESNENFDISNIYFAGNDVFFIKENRIYLWKYLK